MNSNQELFMEWLSGRLSSFHSSKYRFIISDEEVSEIEAFAKRKKIFSGSLYDVCESYVTGKLLKELDNDRLFRLLHNKQIRNITELVRFYHEFTKENETKTRNIVSPDSYVKSYPVPKPKPEYVPQTKSLINPNSDTAIPVLYDALPGKAVKGSVEGIVSNDTNSTKPLQPEYHKSESSDFLILDFNSDSNYAFTKPLSFSYFGEDVVVTSWRKLYVEICRFLYDDYPHVFAELRDDTYSGDRKNLIYDVDASKRLTTPVKITDGYYVETNRSASDLVHNTKILLDYCLVDYENLEIHYVKTERETEAVPSPSAPVVDSHSDKTKVFHHSSEYTVKAQSEEENTVQNTAPDAKYQLDSRKAFSVWFQDQGSPNSSVRTALWAFSKVDEYAVKHGLVPTTLYDVTDPAELDRIWEILMNTTEFVAFRKHNSVCSFAFNKYRAFRSQEGTVSGKEVTPILAESGINADVKRNRRNFITYLLEQGYTETTSNGMASAVQRVSDYAIEHGFYDAQLFTATDVSQLSSLWRRLETNSEFSEYNRNQNRRFAFAINHYIAFRKSGNRAERSPEESQNSNSLSPSGCRRQADIHPGRVEFEQWLKEMNCPAGTIKRYTDSVESIGRFLLINGLENRNIYAIRGISRLEKIRNDLLQNAEYRATSDSVSIGLDLYALKKYISFRKNDSSGDLDEENVEHFSAILHEFFENGFRPNSLIDRNRFKQFYADKFGYELQQSDGEIVQILKQIGTLQDERIYAREGSEYSDLLDDILADIAATFKLGASCIYCSELYAKYQDKLASQLQIFSVDVMKEQLISESYGTYRTRKDYFYTTDQSPDADADIRKLIQLSPAPLDYGEIHEKLWYIPLDTIKFCLVKTPGLVNVAQETYFNAQNLPVSAEELIHIAELIHGQLEQKSFITDAEVRKLIEKHCPSVAINTESFTTWGLRNCLAILLNDRFSFNGPIISEHGRELSTHQVFKEFSRSHEVMTLDELKAFAKDVSNGIIYWDSVMEVMIRTSQEEFVPKGRIQFDVEAIDAVLDGLLAEEYAPLKNFQLFLHYPPTSVKWNEFVLESYVSGYSKEFSLMHASYTATECCGGIVRKASEIKDFQGLVTNVLANSDNWQTKDDALNLLVKEGYLQRRHYAKIDMIIHDAKLQREKNKSLIEE